MRLQVIYRFGPFEFSPQTRELRQGAEVTRLPAQPARLLTLLASRPGEFVTRAEIARALWGTDVHVDEELGINFAVRQLRAALGDRAAESRHIETLPRQGYRLVSPVEQRVKGGRRRLGLQIAAALTSAAALVAAIIGASWASRPPRLLVEIGGDPVALDVVGPASMSERIVAELGRPSRPRVEVIAPRVAAAYVGRPFPDVRQELALDFLLHASFRTLDGGRVGMHAKLVEAESGVVRWVSNQEYDAAAFPTEARVIARELAEAVSGSTKVEIRTTK